MLVTDNFIPGDGFYFDDFEISDYNPDNLGLSESNILSEVKIFPNPFENSISIIGIDEADAIIYLHDAQGRTLKFSVERNNNGYFIVGLNALTSGLYFLKIQAAAGEETVKRIIKR